MGVRCENYFTRLPAPLIADVAKSWGIDKGYSHTQFKNAITRALKDPQQIQRLIAGLQPYERLALEIAKSQGGQISTSILATTLQLLEVEHPFKVQYNSDNDFAQALIRRGIFIPEIRSNTLYYNPNYDLLMSDERILAQVGEAKFPQIPLKVTSAPDASSYRPAASVVFSILGFMQAIADLGGVKLTKSGVPQVNSFRKLMKAQRWEDTGTLIDGFWFPQPTVGMTEAFTAARVLIPKNEESILVLANPVEVFANRPYLTQVGQILSGFTVVSNWAEWSPSGWINVERYIEARQTLLQVLKLLPVDTQDWYSLDDLEKFLFERIGDRFSLVGNLPSPLQFKKFVDQPELAQRWREERQKDWQNREKQWLRQAFATWLYLLGIVELGLTRSAPTPPPTTKKKSAESLPPNQTDFIVSFRLTELGRALLHPELALHLVEMVPQPAWIVQPNFEILVYLDQVAPSQIVFLDRYAERIDLQQHTAQYRLTRESVYQGLERGSSLEEFIDLLRAGAKVAIPQNVEIDIRQWGGLREQITLRRDTQIVEFPDSQIMQAAIAKGLKGKILGDRFILLEANTPLTDSWVEQRIHYDQPLASCLSVNEIGEVKTQEVADLLLETQLKRWMEPQGENWALTQASVTQAVRSGNKVIDILEFLEERLTHSLPQLLKVALTAWCGRAPSVEMEEIIVLRCINSEVFTAIAKSKKLRSHFAGKLAPDVLLVKSSQLQKLKQDLEWFGINSVEQLTIQD